MPLPSKLTSTTQAHVEQLIEERTFEGAHIDFKRELPPTWNDGAKHELYADVSAFANVGGGDLIYGIDEGADSEAAVIVPQVADGDATTLRLKDFLLNGVEPRMPGLEVQQVPVAVDGVNGFVFIIRVPQSWAGPHRVRSNFKFYIREGNRKRDLSVPEICQLVVRTQSQAERVRNFRTERLGKLLAGDGPCELEDGSLWVIHLVPTQAALGDGGFDPLPYLDFARQIPALGGTATNSRVNLDGALGLRNQNNGVSHGYTQLFRNGFVEGVYVIRDNAAGQRVLPGTTYENHAAAFLTRIRDEMRHTGIHPEMVAMMSILNADRVALGFDRFRYDADGLQGSFDRKNVVLPDVLVPAEQAPHEGLKPMFDLVWQAAGMRGSINFDADGRWAPPRV
ncbi:ATP-binding protein [Paraburkholderia sediminicola]|uniref:AlbA family DNA-binding domain-containing protein n=1 Tax=Paraburkholderia sediminicola TaxID=458836 RepID=UPI0038BABD52